MLNLLAYYDRELKDVDPEQYDGDDYFPDPDERLEHVKWMLQQARAFENGPKQQRWIGFIQGVLWCTGERSIKELREEVERAKLGIL